MNKISLLIGVATVALIAIIGVSMYFSYNNQEVRLRKEAEAQIKKVEVGGFDFLKDSVVLRVTYEGKFKGNEVDSQFKG